VTRATSAGKLLMLSHDPINDLAVGCINIAMNCGTSGEVAIF
jgi:hypothetical protein